MEIYKYNIITVPVDPNVEAPFWDDVWFETATFHEFINWFRDYRTAAGLRLRYNNYLPASYMVRLQNVRSGNWYDITIHRHVEKLYDAMIEIDNSEFRLEAIPYEDLHNTVASVCRNMGYPNAAKLDRLFDVESFTETVKVGRQKVTLTYTVSEFVY